MVQMRKENIKIFQYFFSLSFSLSSYIFASVYPDWHLDTDFFHSFDIEILALRIILLMWSQCHIQIHYSTSE